MTYAKTINTTTEFPWCGCKVAFGIDDFEKFERWLDRTECGKRSLPTGWTFCESDGSGARYVAVFRVETMITKTDGERVLRLLKRHGGY